MAEMRDPTQEEKARVCEWWYRRRKELAAQFHSPEREVPAEVVWHIADHGPLTEDDIAWAREVAEKFGLLGEGS